MICPKCGNQLPDDAKFCGVCGNAISQENTNPNPQPETNNTETAQPVNDTPVQPADSTPVQNNFNPIPNNNGAADGSNFLTKYMGQIVVGVAAVVVLILVIVIFNALFGGGYKDPIKNRMKVYNKRSTDVEDYYNYVSGNELTGEYYMTLSKMMADANDEDEEDWEDDIIDSMEDSYDYYDDEYGDDWEMSVDEWKSAKKLSDNKLEDIQDEWEDHVEGLSDDLEMYEDNDDYDEDYLDKLFDLVEDYEKMEVKKGYKVKVKLLIEGDDDDDSNTVTYTVVKIGGKWIILELI